MEKRRSHYYTKENLFTRNFDDSSKTIGIIGRSGSGKTYFLCSELNKIAGHKRGGTGKDRERPVYDLLLFMTESIDASPMRLLDRSINLKMIRGYHPRVVQLLKKIQDSSRNAFRFLVLMDDIVDEKALRKGTFVKQICVLRNSHISTCFLCQYPKMVPPAVRNSCHHLFFTGVKPEELEYLLKSFLSSHAREAVGNIRSLGELSEEFHKFIGSNILHYGQRYDKMHLIQRDPLPEE